MVKIIGLCGIAGSGKDTCALAIKESEINTEVFAFAWPLKEACKILFNFSDEQLHNSVAKEEIDERWERSPRQILQWLGTDILRNNIKKDFFIVNMKQRIDTSKAEYIVISDVRFDNEAELIRSMGGKIIKVVRSGKKNIKYSEHETELGISPELIDTIVENNGTIEEFKNKIKLLKNFLFDS